MMRHFPLCLTVLLCLPALSFGRGVFTYVFTVPAGGRIDESSYQLAKAASECGVTDFILEIEPADSAANASELGPLLEFMDNHGMRAELSRPSGKTYPAIDGDGHMAVFLKMNAGQAVMGGDPRLLSSVEWNVYRDWAYWLRRLARRHPALPEVQEEGGYFCRVNAQGGLVGVFRSGEVPVKGLDADASNEVLVKGLDGNASYEVSVKGLDGNASYEVPVKGLDADASYEVRQGPEGTVVTRCSGRELSEKGFAVTLQEQSDGELYEIARL